MPFVERVQSSRPSRRGFFGVATLASLAIPGKAEAAESKANVLGPSPGYSPQIGTLVSEMTWMRTAVLAPLKSTTVEQLDYLLDPKANRIGALLLHLAATETLYQLITFHQVPLKDLAADGRFQQWDMPMELGDPAREAIKGHALEYYTKLLTETREKTLVEFRKRDDTWLMAIDQNWGWGPTNNLCKWFHVCEHESHHSGQISLIQSRVPGAKKDGA